MYIAMKQKKKTTLDYQKKKCLHNFFGSVFSSLFSRKNGDGKNRLPKKFLVNLEIFLADHFFSSYSLSRENQRKKSVAKKNFPNKKFFFQRRVTEKKMTCPKKILAVDF